MSIPVPTEHRRSVLVVDDVIDAADSAAELLALSGFTARVAYNGLDALEAILVSPPDAVVFDLVMPGMSGYELAGRLTRLPGPRPFLVAMSARPDTPHHRAATGIDLHLMKPTEPDVLIGAL